MTHRDLYFSTYHQAAHAVTAILLGCRVDYVDADATAEDQGWNLESGLSPRYPNGLRGGL